MINVSTKILDAWYSMLNGQLSIDGTSVPVYRTDAPQDAPAFYVVLRVESSTDRSTNSSFVTYPVLISEVVTRFSSGELIRDDIAASIDSQIATLIKPTPSTIGLTAQSGIQIVSVSRNDETYLPEDDGINRYFRLITRNTMRIKQH
jgi:hypothetical protein